MRNNFKADIAIAFLVLSAVIAFAFAYNSSVTNSVTNMMYNDRDTLTAYNNEIIEKLEQTASTDDWNAIVEGYHELAIIIEDSSNQILTRTESRTSSALDVKVRTAFEYHGQAYLIVSSVYLLRDYEADSRELVHAFFIEFLIGISTLFLLFFIIYTIIMRPYRKFYFAMEQYDRTGKLEEQKFKGYVGKIYQRFAQLTEHLEKEQENQQRIIANISHDIKTPLTSILGYAERLERDDLPPERRARYLATIYGKAQEIRLLMDEFDEYLSYKMIAPLHMETLTTEKMKELLEREYRSDLELLNVAFAVNNLSPQSCGVVDRMRMNRVFGNLISNSVKHLPESGGRIEIDLFEKDDMIHTNVSDNGEGVDEEKLEEIFEPLYTSDEGRKVAGLGLSISREIVESLGGTIHAEPAKLGGLCICITLPKGDPKDVAEQNSEQGNSDETTSEKE